MKETRKNSLWGPILSGSAAGLANGLFGAGGGMVLLPLLSRTTRLSPREVFANCVCIILPLSLVSAAIYFLQGGMTIEEAVPYLIGGAGGGILAGILLKKLPTLWLHRIFGLLILWGSFRLLLR